ncbi:hypothetical protein [Sorangium sp. So ce513]|uniref:hypothetical protein n=1 Tax=Sorangium sp. So ce513 TaxID=3133315 RepID=UPI003F620B60
MARRCATPRGWLRGVARLLEHLRGRGHGEANLRFCPDEAGTHSEDAWRRRAPGALELLFAEAAREQPGGAGAPEGPQQAA